MKYLTLLFLLCFSCSKEAESNPPIDVDPVERSYSYIALGDSYTIGESVEQAQRFPEQLQDSIVCDNLTLDYYEIVATTGWTTTNLLNALNSKDFDRDTIDIVTLLIGVNNQFQNRPIALYEKEFAELLDRSITLTGGDSQKVIVVSIPDYGYTPFGSNNQATISEELDVYNSIKKAISEMKNTRYVDITDISRRGFEETDLVANDGLHPSGEQYRQWVERIVVEAREILECD